MKKILMIISAVTVFIFSVSIYAFNGSKVDAATVGQKLTAPEEGWQRYEESNSLIVYNGTWHTNTGSIYGGGSNKYGDNASVEFVFYGTQIRFIGGISTTASENIQIYVDGSLHGSFSQKGSSVVTALNYEIRNLPLGNHKIKVVTKERMVIDSIDINSDGKLIPVSEYQTAQSNIYVGNDAMYQLDKNGDLYTWGSNNYGQLGLGDTSSRSISKSEKVSISEKVTDLVIGERFVIALGESGKVYGWGDNTGKLLSDDGGIVTSPVVIKEGIGAIFKAE